MLCKNRFPAFCVFLLLFVNTSFAFQNKVQDPAQLSPAEHLKLADRYFAESIFYSAVENYKAFLIKKPNDRYANYWLAMAEYHARDYENSVSQFEKFYSLQPKKEKDKKKWESQNKEFFKHGNFYYGMALFKMGEYAAAKQKLNSFRTDFQTQDDKEFATLTTLAKTTMNACDSVPLFLKAKVKVKAQENLNTPYNESAPFALNEDILFYNSINQANLLTYSNYKNDFHSAIFQSTKDETGNWQKGGKVVSVEVNDSKYWVGNGTFNAERTRFYFTKCLEMDDDRSLCNIFEASFKKGKLGEPKRLPATINFDLKFTSTHPAVAKGSKEGTEILYFSSNRPLGKGGLDIWYTQRDKSGLFSEPKLVEGDINTVGDEVTPFFDDSTKTLYYASDGHIGFGGFDIFRADKDPENNRGWMGSVNLGKPLNSGADELYFTKSITQKDGFFTSNRKGTKPLNGIATASDDIFKWENFKYAVDGKVKKGTADKTIATIDNTIANPLAIKDSIADGDSILEENNAQIIAEQPKSDLEEMKGTVVNLYVKKPNGEKYLFGIDSTSNGGNYFFNLDPDMDYEVEVLKPGYAPKIEQLTTKGLDDEDTVSQQMKVDKDGYVIFGTVTEAGKPTNKINGANLTIYELANGTQTVFREVSVPADLATYLLILPAGKDYKIMARKEGYFAGSNRFSTKTLGNNTDSLKADIQLKKIQLNVEYRLNNILYEFGKSTLTESSKLVLDTLYNILAENPKLSIELSAHTDSVGSDAGNMKLSQARAQSCVDYLISKNIGKNRMTAVGYGKRKPIAPNSKPNGTDSPEGRALNRRTEFKILKM